MCYHNRRNHLNSGSAPVGIFTILTVVVLLFELWYLVAFMYAYVQSRDRMMLLQVGQALLLLLAFVYIAYTTLNQIQLNPFIVLMLLLGSMLCSLFWRRSSGGLPRFLQSYPRGTLDVLLFRRPAVDLKRRVRTK